MKLRRRLLTHIHSHVCEGYPLRLIKLFQAVNERSALHCHAAVIVHDAWVRLDHVRCQIEFHTDDITRQPAPPQRKILACRDSRNRFAIDGHLRTVGPSRNPQIKCKFRRFFWRDCDTCRIAPRVVRLLQHFQPGSVFKVPIEQRIVVEMQVKAVSAGAVEIPR